jgi:hypothetical protein
MKTGRASTLELTPLEHSLKSELDKDTDTFDNGQLKTIGNSGTECTRWIS